jgi:UDP-glucose 4-epimerase
LPAGPALGLVHLAAAIPGSIPDETEVARINRSLDDWRCREALDRRLPVVYASTSNARRDAGIPQSEEDALQPAGPYKVEKLRSESIWGQAFSEADVPFSALRITAPYGPGQTARTVLQIFVQRALAGEPLRYFGTGTREQDFIAAADVAQAVVVALAAGARGSFNIGSGQPIAMRNLAEIVVRIIGSTSTVEPAGQPDPQEGQLARISIAKARKTLGWEPRISLEDGLRQLADASTRAAP